MRNTLLLIFLLKSFLLWGSDVAQVKNIIPVDSVKSRTSILATDSTVATDSLEQIIVKDTLIPLNQQALLSKNEYGITRSKNDLLKSDYRYTGNYFSNLPYSIFNDLESLGQPNEIKLYGTGFNNISYFSDGLSINNRMQNAFNLYNIQSEYIDSLEVIPLPRGFIYSQYNNHVSANFYTRDAISRTPYTRLKFYQAPNEEGMIDGIFNAYVGKKLNASFEFTNYSTSSNYENTTFGSWQFSGRLRYMPTNYINIIGSYSYLKSEIELNGGVDVESIITDYYQPDLEEMIYDPLQAPVVYENRYQKTAKHNYSIKMLGSFIENSPTDLTAYYQYNLTEYRQNEKADTISYPEIPTIFNNNSYQAAGVSLKQKFNLDFISLELLSNYESVDYWGGVLKYDDTKTHLSLAGRAKLSLLNNRLQPSVFAKYLNYSDETYNGFGFDLNLKMIEGFNFYAGYSKFQKPLNILEEQYLSPSVQYKINELTTIEAGVNFNISPMSGSVSYFKIDNQNHSLPVIYNYADTLVINEAGEYFLTSSETKGVNLKLDFNFWRILLTNNFTYYLEQEDNSTLPEFTLNGGLYYIDTLFNSNLKLKTGLNYQYTGSRNYYTYDFEKNVAVQYYTSPDKTTPTLISDETFSPYFKLDFFVAGTIQDLATLYFTLENILGQKFYSVPYYPNQGMVMRFGVAWEFFD